MEHNVHLQHLIVTITIYMLPTSVFEKLVQEEEEVEEQMCIQESIPQNWADLWSYTPPQHLPDLSLVTLGKSSRSDCCRQ